MRGSRVLRGHDVAERAAASAASRSSKKRIGGASRPRSSTTLARRLVPVLRLREARRSRGSGRASAASMPRRWRGRSSGGAVAAPALRQVLGSAVRRLTAPAASIAASDAERADEARASRARAAAAPSRGCSVGSRNPPGLRAHAAARACTMPTRPSSGVERRDRRQRRARGALARRRRRRPAASSGGVSTSGRPHPLVAERALVVLEVDLDAERRRARRAVVAASRLLQAAVRGRSRSSALDHAASPHGARSRALQLEPVARPGAVGHERPAAPARARRRRASPRRARGRGSTRGGAAARSRSSAWACSARRAVRRDGRARAPRQSAPTAEQAGDARRSA